MQVKQEGNNKKKKNFYKGDTILEEQTCPRAIKQERKESWGDSYTPVRFSFNRLTYLYNNGAHKRSGPTTTRLLGAPSKFFFFYVFFFQTFLRSFFSSGYRKFHKDYILFGLWTFFFCFWVRKRLYISAVQAKKERCGTPLKSSISSSSFLLYP